ncbi:hypothetical protein IFR09_04650 [Pseudomonas syringae]|nr:hypothetical protein [Pseudomonas syringae]MBD8791684.1 hypothetical protein [Pseudomonas syringae]MBD8801044.1 hypothetical protein [Pseudomonas syringae]MBD8810448.1 hypothetical protein [Pseudomonas syringae]
MNLDQWQQAALSKYLANHPTLKDEISQLSAKEQQQQVQWAFEDSAEEQGIEPWELALELIAESPEQLKSMRLEAHRQVAEALGMDWEEYCGFNGIEP